MIRAEFYRKGGLILGFSITGHAGYDEEGHDIVCASVTSAAQMAANTITEIIGDAAEVTAKEADLTLRLPSGRNRDDTQAVLRGLYLQLELLCEQFKEYVTIEDLEV